VLGVASREDIQTLSRELARLSKKIDTLGKKPTVS